MTGRRAIAAGAALAAILVAGEAAAQTLSLDLGEGGGEARWVGQTCRSP